MWGKKNSSDPELNHLDSENKPKKEVKLALEEIWKEKRQDPSTGPTAEEPHPEARVASETSGLQEEGEKVKQERDEYLDHLKRLQAEFDNYRKRVQKERVEMSEYLLQDFMSRMVSVMENLERALHPDNQIQDFQSYRAGVEMVWKQLTSLLEESGLQRIVAEGQPFDPRYHEAVAQVETEATEPGIIVKEYSPGYRLKERVLRAPKVQVAVRPARQET
jgi:molecular chaperone GrpE